MEKSVIFPLQITADNEGCIPLKVFEPFLDVSKVAYYEFLPKEEMQLELRLYDKDKQRILPREG